MKKQLVQQCVLTSTCLFITALVPVAFGQGALTPPGAPAPTMKTLAQVEPRTPISSAPFTISVPGSYYLTTNLTGAGSANGITISNGNVTLDLNGFSLKGVSGSLSGVYIGDSFTNITVHNGTITGWGQSGVNASSFPGSRNMVFERLTVSANHGYGIVAQAGSVVRDCCSIGNFDGISCNGSLISGCMVRDSTEFGIYASDCMVRNCQVWNSSEMYGIFAIRSTVRDCQALSNGGHGIQVLNSTVSGCYAGNNGSSGIYVYDGNQIIGNNSFANSGSAFNEAGILVSGANNRIEDNHVTSCAYAGIWIVNTSGSNTNNIIVKNTVISSGNNYDIPAGQIRGPIITNTVSGVITNSNPWANFSF